MYNKRKTIIRKTFAAVGILGVFFLNLVPLASVNAATALTLENLTAYAESVNATNTDNGLSNSTSAAGGAVAAANKGTGPVVQVTFTPEGGVIKNGAKITAQAISGGFLTEDTKNLYFTWYIKHDGCDLENNPNETIKKTCDFDGDSKITVNDWKIVATRNIIKGGFIRSDADYSAKSANTDMGGGLKAVPSVGEWERTVDPEQENDSSGSIPNCYVQEPSSGLVYELRESEPVFNACPNGYHPACVQNTTASCNVLNPLFVANPVGTDPKSIENTFGACSVNTESTNSDAKDILDCDIASDADLKNFKSYAGCSDGAGTAICAKDGGNTDLLNGSNVLIGTIFNKGKIGNASANETNGVCGTLAKPNIADDPTEIPPDPIDPPPYFLDNTQPLITASAESCSTITAGLISGNATLNLLAGNFNKNSSTCTFQAGNNLCKHLFPYFPKNSVVLDSKTIDLRSAATGDGKFTMAEKEFWGADPAKESTNGTTQDEASVMGLGVDKITWTYAQGDEIGVVVEGTSSLATDHTDSSYRIMWAFSKGTCSALESLGKSSSLSEGERGFYLDSAADKGIFTADFDLNDCLEENLLEPDSGGLTNIKVDLTASPNNPINDPNGMGDQVSVTASIQNVEDLSGMYYDWKIEKSKDEGAVPTDDTTWTDITSDMIQKYGSLLTTDKQGVGKNVLTFSLNLPADEVDPTGEGVFYLRTRVTATENSGASGQVGKGALVIKVREQQNQIDVYSVIAADDGNLSLNDGVGASQLCSDVAGRSVCYVTKNQVVGMTIPNKPDKNGDRDLSGFSWKVNGVVITCDSSVSSTACGGTDNNSLFIPILGNVGEAVDVVATAISKKTSSTLEIIRHFIIVEPQILITSQDANSAWPKILGFYKDLSGNRTPDYSTQVFETYAGNTMILNAVAYSAWNSGYGFVWTIDGQIQNSSSDVNNNQITIVADKQSGDSYNIGLVSEATHSLGQDKLTNNLRRALLKNWGISPNDFIDETSSANIQINVLENPNLASAKSGKIGIFASLATNLPEQLMFLLKITLTSFMLVFSMGLLFAIVPESLFERKSAE